MPFQTVPFEKNPNPIFLLIRLPYWFCLYIGIKVQLKGDDLNPFFTLAFQIHSITSDPPRLGVTLHIFSAHTPYTTNGATGAETGEKGIVLLSLLAWECTSLVQMCYPPTFLHLSIRIWLHSVIRIARHVARSQREHERWISGLSLQCRMLRCDLSELSVWTVISDSQDSAGSSFI